MKSLWRGEWELETTNEKSRKSVINRLRTIKGHIAGIEKMVEDGKCCDDILLQIAAVKASIHKVGLVIVEENAMNCLTTEDGETIDKERMEEVIKTLVKYAK